MPLHPLRLSWGGRGGGLPCVPGLDHLTEGKVGVEGEAVVAHPRGGHHGVRHQCVADGAHEGGGGLHAIRHLQVSDRIPPRHQKVVMLRAVFVHHREGDPRVTQV
eukprot:8254195-Pyramimonas_sp.AAC.1